MFKCLELSYGKWKISRETSKGIYVITITRFLHFVHCQILKTEHIL
jgi:hypothetical protein